MTRIDELETGGSEDIIHHRYGRMRHDSSTGNPSKSQHIRCSVTSLFRTCSATLYALLLHFVPDLQSHQRPVLRRPERIPLPEAPLVPAPLDRALPCQCRPKPHKCKDVGFFCLPCGFDECEIENVEGFHVFVVFGSSEHDVESELVRT